MLRGLTVAGAVLALVGSFVMVADYWAPFHNLLSKISAFARAEKGWEKLCQFEYQDKKGKAFGMLREDDTGFRKILRIILGKRSEYRAREISAIICSEGMAYNLGQGRVAQRYISLCTEGQSTPDVIAPTEQVEEWISEARLRFVLFLGFLLLLLGFLFSFPASIRQARFKPG